MSFNDVMRAFLIDLTEVFPENGSIQSARESFEDIVSINYKKPAHMFAESMKPHVEKIMRDDDTVVDDMHFPGIDFKQLWNSDISDNTKNAIFSYLKQLLILAWQKN